MTHAVAEFNLHQASRNHAEFLFFYFLYILLATLLVFQNTVQVINCILQFFLFAYLQRGRADQSQEQVVPKPYSFTYTAGRMPGHVDRVHSETADGLGTVRGLNLYYVVINTRVIQYFTFHMPNAIITLHIVYFCINVKQVINKFLFRIGIELWPIHFLLIGACCLGMFSYVDPRQKIRTVEYIADQNGFHPILITNPTQDTTAVQNAKAKHYVLYNQIAAQHQMSASENENDQKEEEHDVTEGFDPNLLISHPQDTPVVEKAKLRHYDLYNRIALEHAKIAAERMEYGEHDEQDEQESQEKIVKIGY